MIFWTIIIILVNLHAVFGQNEALKCRYFEDDALGYTCDLSVRNANGVSNFTHINGTHLVGYDDYDVAKIHSYANRSASSNVPSILCSQFPNTRRILLRDIAIQNIDENSFAGCENAISIELPNNRITNLNDGTFTNNPKLQTLFLNNNNLTTLSENLLQGQSGLVYLSFSYNRILDFPRNFFRALNSLKDLNLVSNLLTNLKHEWFRNLTSLENLILNTNQIMELPSYIFINLRNLKSIEMYSNKLIILHADSFGVLLKLTHINVNSNSINFIDERLIDNTDVNFIDVRSNICVSTQISDSSASRSSMRSYLRKCLDNYLNLVSVCRHQKMIPPDDDYPLECTSGDWDERICSLEKRSDKFEDIIISEIRSENQKILVAIEDVNTRLTELENRPSTCY